MHASIPDLAYGSRDIAILVMLKQANTKEIEYYYWLYLKINISEFRLIWLDHITYVSDYLNKQGITK